MSQPISFKLEYSTLKVPRFKSNDFIVAIFPDSFPVIISPTDNSYSPEIFKVFLLLFVTIKSLTIPFEDKVSPIVNWDSFWDTLKVG